MLRLSLALLLVSATPFLMLVIGFLVFSIQASVRISEGKIHRVPAVNLNEDAGRNSLADHILRQQHQATNSEQPIPPQA